MKSNEKYRPFGPDDDAVSALLSELPTVEAPKDFNFRVRARIAGGSAAEARSGWMPRSVRVAIPLCLVAIAGGYLGLTSIYNDSAVTVADVAEVQTASPEQALPIAVQNDVAPVIEEVATARPVPPNNNATVVANSRRIAPQKPKADRPTGGSFDTAFRKADPITPENTNADRGTIPSGTISLRELGITVVTGPEGRIVRSVAPASPAARAGVKTGDILISFDSRAIVLRRGGTTLRLALPD